MGVVHKLKQEVVDFIVERKKQDPSLSCRKLVEIVKLAFSITLSKSSVNTILKESLLSSPVGRRAIGEKKQEKFQIPADKKKVMFQVPLSQPQKPKKKTTTVKKPSLKEDLPSAPPSKPSSLAPQSPPGTDAQPVPVTVGTSSASSKGAVYDGMGSIFLKACEWELADKSVLGPIFKQHIRGGGLTDIDLASEIMVLMQAFGIKRVSDLPKYQKNGLWALHGRQEAIDVESLNQVLASIDDFNGLLMNFSVEIPQSFSEMSFIKMKLSDGQELWIDSELTSVWPPAKSLPMTASVHRVMDYIAKQLLNNLQPLIFCSVSGESSFSKEFISAMAAFENVPGKTIQRISVCDRQHQEMAEFAVIPDKKRVFLVGVWPWQAEFGAFVKAESASNTPFEEVHIQGQDYLLKEIKVLLSDAEQAIGNVHYRVILLHETQGDAPAFAVLTNAPVEAMGAQEVARAYVDRWPNRQAGFNLFAVNPAAFSGEESLQLAYLGKLGESVGGQFSSIDINQTISTGCDLEDILGAYASLLSQCSQKWYFPSGYSNVDINSMISSIYSLNGEFSRDQDEVRVKLLTGESSQEVKNALNFAKIRINERHISDFGGRRLILL